MDIREIIRRFRMGEGIRRIAFDLGICRNTVKKYRAWARDQGLLEGPPGELPGLKLIDEKLRAGSAVTASASVSASAPTGPASTVEAHREFIVPLRRQGVEMRAIHQLLQEQKGFTGSYSAVRRFVKRLKAEAPVSADQVFLRIETEPGEEAQVDFGYAGKLFDPVVRKLRKAWVFVMTLCFSRHLYAEIVFDQSIARWIALHVRAFECFGGVVHRVVIDNLKAGIARIAFNDEQATRSYRELAEHYEFLISPCRPRTPRHKGKVEQGGVHYVKRNALAGRVFKDIDEANAHLARWRIETAGARVHGTTRERPLDRFERVEKAALQPLPPARFEIVVWKKAKVHSDCHVNFEYAYYSAPFRLVGQGVLVRATPWRVEIYQYESSRPGKGKGELPGAGAGDSVLHERVASHPRAGHKGQRMTVLDHLPPEKLRGLVPPRPQLQAQADAIGPYTAQAVARFLAERPVERLRAAQGVLALVGRGGVTAARLEAACKRAIVFDDVRYPTIRQILKRGLDLEPIQDPADTSSVPAPLPKTSLFARQPWEMQPRPKPSSGSGSGSVFKSSV